MNAGKSKLLLSGLILLGIFLLAACASQPTPSPTAEVVSPIVSSTPAVALTSTSTATPAEPEFIEPTPTAPPYTRCQEIIDAQLPKDFLTEGSIIFDGECEGRKGLFRLSADTRKIEPFLDDFVRRQYNYGVRLSPDRQWLAVDAGIYDENGISLGDLLIVTGENDTNVIQYPWDRNWGISDEWGVDKEWLGNQKMRIALWRAGTSQVLLDVFSGKMDFLKLPDNHTYESDSAYYASDLARLLAFNKDSNSYSLFDLTTGRELWKSQDNLIQQTLRYQSTMDSHLWSPDNLMVAFPVLGRSEE